MTEQEPSNIIPFPLQEAQGEGVSFPIEELVGKEIPPKPIEVDQQAHLIEIDAWMADLFPKLDEAKAKQHEITEWEKRQFEK